MAQTRGWPYSGDMTTFAATSSALPDDAPARRGPAALARLRALALAAGVILAAFTAFSLWVIGRDGLGGLLAVVGREPWGLQLLLDLAISLTFALGWVRADARRLGIASWPFVAAAPLVGSIAVLAYVVRRGAVTPRRGT